MEYKIQDRGLKIAFLKATFTKSCCDNYKLYICI